jgi:hypothetical protein
MAIIKMKAVEKITPKPNFHVFEIARMIMPKAPNQGDSMLVANNFAKINSKIEVETYNPGSKYFLKLLLWDCRL